LTALWKALKAGKCKLTGLRKPEFLLLKFKNFLFLKIKVFKTKFSK